jgi:hypothetical protein
MLKKINLLLLFSLAMTALAACSSLPGVSSQDPASASNITQGQVSSDPGQAQPPDFSQQPIEMKLAIGTLKLEGTDQAVTPEQASTLLPLWKAVKVMSADTNTSTEEMDALYAQIQESMTAEQVQAIQDLSLTREDTQALMQQYGIEMFGPGGAGDPLANLSEDERATRIAEFRAQGGGQGAQGGPVGEIRVEGGPGSGPQGFVIEGGPPDGAAPQEGQMPQMEGTPQPGMVRRGFGGGMNTLFVEPLIKLLEERAGG